MLGYLGKEKMLDIAERAVSRVFPAGMADYIASLNLLDGNYYEYAPEFDKDIAVGACVLEHYSGSKISLFRHYGDIFSFHVDSGVVPGYSDKFSMSFRVIFTLEDLEVA